MSRLVAVTVIIGIAVPLAVSSVRAHERITTSVTWDREISAIVRARCVTCHRDGGSSSIPLSTYAEARPWARAIKHEVMTRRMPIWRAARGYGDFDNDPSLSPFEIALVAAWVEGGAPRSFVPKGTTATRLPGPAETPLTPEPEIGNLRPAVRDVPVPCGDHPAPRGRLLGLRPELRPRDSVRVLAAFPDGRAESLGWFSDFDPKSPQTYWLSTPLVLSAGARIRVSQAAAEPWLLETTPPASTCSIVLLFDAANGR